MTRYQTFNPIDTLFYVYDQAVRRVGLPGSYIQNHMRMAGRVDVAGLRRAIAVIHRAYPATAGRLERDAITGRPRWRLDVARPDADPLLHIHPLRPATEEELERQTHLMLATPIELDRPPMQFHLFRGLPEGDVLMMRWPHFFMDVSGVGFLVDDLRAAYDAQTDPNEQDSKQDERRTDFADLVANISPWEKARMLSRLSEDGPPPGWRDAMLPDQPIARPYGKIRYLIRVFDDDQTRRVHETASRMCGFARYAAFLRASAIRAMHRVMPHALRPNQGYSTLSMIDYRRRRTHGPVCHNHFGGVPAYVPAELVEDRKAVALMLDRTTRRARKDGRVLRTQVANDLLSKLPTSMMIEALADSLRPGFTSSLPLGFGKQPSIQVGFMTLFRERDQFFCGTKLKRVYGFGLPPLHTGFAVDVNLSLGRLHMSVTYIESRVSAETVRAFIDDFAAALTDPADHR